MMISNDSGANQIAINVDDEGLVIAVNQKTYKITLDPAEAANMGIALMRQAHEKSKKNVEANPVRDASET